MLWPILFGYSYLDRQCCGHWTIPVVGFEAATPLVVVDVYEHAFYIDYHNRKAKYIEKFMDHIDWAEVSARYRSTSQ